MDIDDEIKQPGIDIQERLDDLMNAEPTEIVWRGRKKKIGWMRHGVQRKFSSIMLKDKSENVWRRNVKLCACLLLNGRSGFWTMVKEAVVWPVYWRWLYYVASVDMTDVLQVLEASKKKIQIEACLLCTISATGVMDTMMTMRSEEVRVGQAGRS